MPVAVIALATWQGVAYLPELLTSLEQQERRPDLVVVGDDGSTDGGPDLIQTWSERTGIAVHRLPPHGERLGPCQNFARILEHCRSILDAVVFLCDQDDRWHPSKIRIGCQLANDRLPRLLVHDLRLIDAQGQVLANSFLKHQGYRARHGATPAVLAAMNSFPGCGMICNHALLERALPIPHEAVMHDWWLALVAATTGRIRFDPRILVDYRQHGANTVGAFDGGLSVQLRRMTRVLTSDYRTAARASQAQARALIRHLGPGLPNSIRAWALAERLNPVTRRIAVLRHGVRKTGWLRNLGMLSRG